MAVDAPYVVTNLTSDGQGRFILHLLNYDHEHVIERVQVTLDLPPASEEYAAKALSPDESAPALTEVSSAGGSVSFVVGPLSRYAVVRLVAGP